jgi:hypothetical protein
MNYHSSNTRFLSRPAPELCGTGHAQTVARATRRQEQEEKYLQEVQKTDDDADIESVGSAISRRTTLSSNRRSEHAEATVTTKMVYLEDLETQLQERDGILAALREETSQLKKHYAEVIDMQKDEIWQAAEELEAYREKFNGIRKFRGKGSFSLSKRPHGAHGEKITHESSCEDFSDHRKRHKCGMTEPSKDLSERLKIIEAAAMITFRPETLEDLEPLDTDDDMHTAEPEKTADVQTLQSTMDREIQREQAARLAAESALQEERRAHAATQSAHAEVIRARDEGVHEIEQNYSRHLAAVHSAHLQELEAVRAQATITSRQLVAWLGRKALRSTTARIAIQRASIVARSSALKAHTELRKARQASRDAARKDAREIKALRARVEELERRHRKESRTLPGPPPLHHDEPESKPQLGISAAVSDPPSLISTKSGDGGDGNSDNDNEPGPAPTNPTRADPVLNSSHHRSDCGPLQTPAHRSILGPDNQGAPRPARTRPRPLDKVGR